jgi:hypothetical protein
MTPMEQFPGNSKNVTGAKQPAEKNVEKIVTTDVVVRKKTIGKKMKDIFFGGDFKNAFRYVAADVLLPAVRNMIADAGTEGIRRIIFPESQARVRRDYRSGYAPRTSYNNPLIRPGRDPREAAYLPQQPPHVVKQSRSEINEIIFPTRDESMLVLEGMINIIDKFETVSVADFYTLIGLPSTYVDNSWGWTFLNNVDVRQIREGFVIDFPAPEPLR